MLEPRGARPSAREDHTWTVSDDGVAYLFGGRADATVHGDLWAYDLAADAWTALEPTGQAPPARFGHEAEWVEGIGLVVFAGQAGTTFFNDLWAYDPTSAAWRQLPAAGDLPVARYGTCAAIGPDGRLWVSHGFTADGARFSDTRAYDFDAESWTDETPAGEVPVSRCLHGCWWTDDGRLALVAGQTTDVTALDDRWWLTPGEGWVRQADDAMPARNRYAFARGSGSTWVFGGEGPDGAALADLWKVDDDGGVRAVSTGAGAAPPGRWGAELIVDIGRDRILLFGGRDGRRAHDDTWVLVAP